MEYILANLWWIATIATLIVLVAGFKLWFRLILGGVIVPDDKVGLVTKNFTIIGEKELPSGRIIATRGEAGMQADVLAPGLYLWKWVWQYNITMDEFTVITPGNIGLVLSRDGVDIPTGHILAQKVECNNFQDAKLFLTNNGFKGRQASILTAGSYRINTNLFKIEIVPMTSINDNMVGLVTTRDGEPLIEGHIAGEAFEGHNNFQDFDAFLKAGGRRGRQQQIILAGSYNLNPWAIEIVEVPMTEIPIGYVGVVISFVGEDGEDVTGAEFKHGNIVNKGQKGVWIDPYGPGKYPLNTYTMRIEPVPTTNLVLNWADARTESHNLDKELSTITVRSKDGFKFNLDVSQIIHIPLVEAPKVIARFGSMQNLVSQVLEPTIGNYFRNSAQDSDVIAFLISRQQRQESAKSHIKAVLDQYNVNAVDTLIGDIIPPDTLMTTLTDRKLAEELKKTYETQKMAQITRQELEKETAIAGMQKQVVEADQGIFIAQKRAEQAIKTSEGDSKAMSIRADGEASAITKRAVANAEQVRVLGEAEGSAVLAVGKSTAESYQLQVAALGANNFTQMKVTEYIGDKKVKVMPDVLIMGGNGNDGANGPISGLLGYQLMQTMAQKQNADAPVNAPVSVVVSSTDDTKKILK